MKRLIFVMPSPRILRGTKVPPMKQKERPTMLENTMEGAEAKAGTFANMEIIMATTRVKISAFSTESHHASLKS